MKGVKIMKAILKREIKNFLKNPIFWAGLLIMVAGIYQILQPYLELHYFTSNAEIQNMSVSSLEDADVMEGYIPVSDEERTENGYEEIYRTMTEDMGLTTEEANEAISSIRGMNTEEACDYLEKEYRYYGAQYSLEGSKYKQGDANEVNTYIQKKMQEHPYSYYFARKYADFAGLFMAFFATILLAFLFLRDTRKDTYELLHTKPIAPWQYVLGKVGSGFQYQHGRHFCIKKSSRKPYNNGQQPALIAVSAIGSGPSHVGVDNIKKQQRRCRQRIFKNQRRNSVNTDDHQHIGHNINYIRNQKV